MSQGDSIPHAPEAQQDVPVRCAECQKHNLQDAITCASCGAHLWIKCSKCGTKATRTTSRCGKCHHRLRSDAVTLPRWNRRFRNRKHKRWLRGALVLLLAAISIWLVWTNVPEPAPPPTNSATAPF